MTAPELIDRRGHLAQLGTQAVLAAVAFVAMSWVPMAVGTAVFATSALLWPRGAPILMVWDRLAGRRSQQWLDDGRPARVSTAIAAATFAGLTVAVGGGLDAPLMWAGVLVLCAALAAEVVIGSCLPCEVIVWAARRGLLRYDRPIGDTT